MHSRLLQLEEFFKEDPNDPFNIYALALEYQKTEIKKAKELFDLLLLKHEDYIPTYYHASNLYVALNLTDEAVRILEKGIEKARSKNELKAMRELKTVYDELVDF
jgi:tetratricopeptide (TPR) repeat protein